jgi:hypothetical protein
MRAEGLVRHSASPTMGLAKRGTSGYFLDLSGAIAGFACVGVAVILRRISKSLIDVSDGRSVPRRLTAVIARTAGAAAVAALLAAAPTVVTAAGYAETLGQGTISCRQWLQDRQETGGQKWVIAVHEAWVLGFISGMNSGVLDTLGFDKLSHAGEGTDSEDIFAWIDNYCRERPLDHLAGAALALWHVLRDASK